MTTENQPSTGNPPAPDTGTPDVSKIKKEWEERFDKLKEEIGEKLGEANTSFEALKNQVVTLAQSQQDIANKLNTAISEIRVIGGRQLERANPDVPARVEKKSTPLTLLELVDED